MADVLWELRHSVPGGEGTRLIRATPTEFVRLLPLHQPTLPPVVPAMYTSFVPACMFPSFGRAAPARVSRRPRQVRRTVAVSTRVKMCDADDGSEQPQQHLPNLSVGDALRSWSSAREAGIVPDELGGSQNSYRVLFVGRDNSTVSVAAAAIFMDLVRRRALNAKTDTAAVRFSCHSAGTQVRGTEGSAPSPSFVEGLKFKRGIDVSGHKSVSLSSSDVHTFDLIVCTDENIRYQVISEYAAEEANIDEHKFVVLSQYCQEALRGKIVFRDGRYERDALNKLLSALIDACSGLLASLPNA
jgi:protein-tyrosine-phosphatase